MAQVEIKINGGNFQVINQGYTSQSEIYYFKSPINVSNKDGVRKGL